MERKINLQKVAEKYFNLVFDFLSKYVKFILKEVGFINQFLVKGSFKSDMKNLTYFKNNYCNCVDKYVCLTIYYKRFKGCYLFD